MSMLQETANLYDAAKLQHVCKGEYAAEYELTADTGTWKLTESTVTF